MDAFCTGHVGSLFSHHFQLLRQIHNGYFYFLIILDASGCPSAGVSTNILVKKMEEEAARLGYECTITAYSLAQAAEGAANADVLLLAPQAGHSLAELQVKYPNVPSTVIPQKLYGALDAVEILDLAQKTAKDY